MYDIDEIASELLKYINKLNKLIMNEAEYTWLDKKYVNKQRVDDVLCCLEASLPSEYRDTKDKTYKGMLIYKKIISTIRIQALLNKKLYSINYAEVSVQFKAFVEAVKLDLKKLNDIS